MTPTLTWGVDGVETLGSYKGNMNGNANLTYVVNTQQISTQVVPEPATATLSLLALAGLAARRRRK
jgi:MYXO-CTERM domain-containing protein